MSRREELLAVATKLFAARGYHGTRMDDVADAVGLNKATVYHYYASKSLILYDIYKGAADFTVDALHDDPSASARETIYHFTRRLLVGIASDIERAAVYFQEGPYITEWFTEEQVAYIRQKEAAGLRARPRRDRPRHRQWRVLRLRLACARARLHRHDAGLLPVAAAARQTHRAGDRRRVQHRAAAWPDPRRGRAGRFIAARCRRSAAT